MKIDGFESVGYILLIGGAIQIAFSIYVAGAIGFVLSIGPTAIGYILIFSGLVNHRRGTAIA